MAKFTVAGERAFNRFHRILTIADPLPERYMEITGPEEAFEVQELSPFDLVKVIDPALVTVHRYHAAT